jgi:hypothetical protein
VFSLGSEPRWVLFPRIIVVQEERDEVVFPGIALRDWQAAASAQQLREDIDARRIARGNREGEKGDNEWDLELEKKLEMPSLSLLCLGASLA